MNMNKISFECLYNELDSYERQGIPMMLDGCQASPMQIVQAYMFQDSGSYMRDYSINENGILEALEFNFVQDNHTIRGKENDSAIHS